jgi:putative transposase
MARPPRPQFPDALYHVTSRGNRGEAILSDEAERLRFLEILSRTSDRFGWRCLAYCLMTNHYHLVVRTPKPCISRAMHQLNGVYARWFNKRHGYEGHLFQRRFHTALIESDWHLLESCRYVVLNPVRAGLVRRPGDWEWSSYRTTIGLSTDTGVVSSDELLRFFGSRRTAARSAFEAFVADAPDSVRSGHGQVPGTGAWPG